MSHAIHSLKHGAYGRSFALQSSASAENLAIAERAIFQTLSPRLTGKRLLDIGVGGGRTTAFLLDLSRDYTAIDYCEDFVALVRVKFGIDSVYRCDVRNMSRFADGAFDFVLFSFNGLDYASHHDRIRALAEISRVLADGGLLMFSSHNRNRTKPRVEYGRRLTDEIGGVGLRLRRTLQAALLTSRDWLMRRYEIETADYAIVHDCGLRYSLLTYYIRPCDQVAQLERLRFMVEGVYNVGGHSADADDRSPWLYYLASKSPAAGQRGDRSDSGFRVAGEI